MTRLARSYLSVIHLLVVISFAVLFPPHTQAQNPSGAPLIQSNNLTYIGSFKLPSGTLGSTYGFDYAGDRGQGTYGVTYNPASNSLFIGGHPYEQKIAEVGIPASLPGVGTAIQNLRDPTEGKSGQVNPSEPSNKVVGSSFIYNGKLYPGVFTLYDGSGTQKASQFVRPINLSTTGQVQGPFTVGNRYPGWVNKYAAIIPAEWQVAFGGPVLVGGSGGSIDSFQSWGPSASVINPADIGVQNPVPASLLLGYPIDHPLASYVTANQYWSANTIITGMVFPEGTRTILYFGKHGLGNYCYGGGDQCNDPDDASKGTHSFPYEAHVWAYDANDLIGVKNGQKQSWEVRPYAVWTLSSDWYDVQGVGYDPATQRIYLSQGFGDGVRPLIRVYQINSVSTSNPVPNVTISATPLAIVSGSASTLTWNSTNTTSCSASGAWSGTKTTSGSQNTGPLTVNSTYSLTCTGPGGSATRSTTVSVSSTAPPTVTLAASPTSVPSGGAATLSWSSTNATSCAASGAWSGIKPMSGTQSTGALSATSTYALSCTGAGGSASQSTTLTVTASSMPPTSSGTNVSSVSGLQSAVAGLTSNQTILLADGIYNVPATLYLPQNISNVTIKGASGNREAVIIKGPGMGNATVPFAFWLDNVSGATFQDLTIRDFNQHAIIANGRVSSPVYRNLHIIDIGDQFLKNNPTTDGLNGIDSGILENSLLEYSSIAPDTYTNGLDVHRGKNWIVRNNTFRNFRSTAGLAGPAILIWNGSSDSTILRNTFINNQRDISLGLNPTTTIDRTPDHIRGVIANNFIYKMSTIAPDLPIGVFDSPETKVYHNSILLNGGYSNAIEYRFPRTSAVEIKNNLADAAIVARDGASGSVASNITSATSGMFVSASTADLHLVPSATAAIDKGVAVSLADDFDGQPRPKGVASDIGADEFVSTSTPPAAPSNLVLQ